MKTLGRLRISGMDLKKNKNLSIAAGAVLFFVGLAVGALINDLPFVTFKREVDLGTCIAVLGLVATIFIMPFIVQKKLSRQDSINSVILVDLEAINADVERLREMFVGLKPSTTISKTRFMQITALFKTISAEILSLNRELESQSKLPNFKKDVYDSAYRPAYETCTDPLIIGKKLDEMQIYEANKTLNNLCTSLRKYRYETFA